MGIPYFQLQELRQQHDISIFSSNYTLYGDMSARVMATLGQFVEEVEVYSIDEAFLELTGYESVYPDLVAFGTTLRATVGQWTRIPVCVGIAPTKTLCKIANWYAKRQPDAARPEHGGVYMLDTPAKITGALANFDIADLWGIGWRYAGMLKRNGIRTAAQFRDLPDDLIRDHLTVNGLRVAYELRGIPCKMLETEAPAKQTICTAPSFGRPVSDLSLISQAMVTHVGRMAEKLRKQESAASAVTVFLHTNRFKRSMNGEPARQYHNSLTIELPHPTASTTEVVRYAQEALKAIFRFGYAYQKVGVMLSGLVSASHRQAAIFTNGPDERLIKLSAAVDKINHRYGRDRVRLAGAGYDPSWKHKRQWLSKRYTTQWKELLKAR